MKSKTIRHSSLSGACEWLRSQGYSLNQALGRWYHPLHMHAATIRRNEVVGDYSVTVAPGFACCEFEDCTAASVVRREPLQYCRTHADQHDQLAVSQ